jgi:hypothetical protein
VNPYLRLAYGDLLLTLLRREVAMSRLRGGVDVARVDALCDRFERVRAALVVAPLVWEGDCA